MSDPKVIHANQAVEALKRLASDMGIIKINNSKVTPMQVSFTDSFANLMAGKVMDGNTIMNTVQSYLPGTDIHIINMVAVFVSMQLSEIKRQRELEALR